MAKIAMMDSQKHVWSIAEGRQNFSRLVKSASRGPQIITSREQPIATLIDYDAFQRFRAWEETTRDRFCELAELCADEDYSLESVGRTSRENPFELE